MIALKYITSLAFDQLCAASEGCKKNFVINFFTGKYYRGKKRVLLRYVMHECSNRGYSLLLFAVLSSGVDIP